jgi:2'-5' RNA ligase
MEDEKTRAFIYLEMPDSVIKEVARVQEVLEKKKFDGKMTELENLHLTLKFLGEIDTRKLEGAREKLKKIKFDKFEAHSGEIGIFSHRKNPRIVWIKLEGKEIWNLQEQIDESLKDLFKKEERFMSHMTIARVKYVKDREGFVKHVWNINTKKIAFPVMKFKLVKSVLGANGPNYTLIEEYSAK